jgi:hypothetical protein
MIGIKRNRKKKGMPRKYMAAVTARDPARRTRLSTHGRV